MEAPYSSQERIGSVVGGRWRLESLVGCGGMGAVYAARDADGAPIAIKILHPAADMDLRRRFAREERIANRLQHPGVVAIVDDGVTDDGLPFLVMELLEGESLAAYAEPGGKRLPVAKVAALADELLVVLERAHAAGILHRDLKPENLFLTPAGSLKVLDFGIARVRDAEFSMLATASNVLMGTPAFMAAEQALGAWDDVDARTDVWAVGATMFTLITGQTVHVARTVNEVLLAAMTQPARPIASAAPETPTPLAHVIDRALAYSRDQRWPSAAAMREALRRAITSMSEGKELAFVPRAATIPPPPQTDLSSLATRVGSMPRISPVWCALVVVALVVLMIPALSRALLPTSVAPVARGDVVVRPQVVAAAPAPLPTIDPRLIAPNFAAANETDSRGELKADPELERRRVSAGGGDLYERDRAARAGGLDPRPTWQRLGFPDPNLYPDQYRSRSEPGTPAWPAGAPAPGWQVR